jgi:hypothetical protein
MRTMMLCAAGLLAGAALSATPAAWANAKAYSGSFCVEESDSAPEIEYSNLSGAFNQNSTWDTFFLCPIVRDEPGEDGNILDAHVSIADGHDAKSVRCRLFATPEVPTGSYRWSEVKISGDAWEGNTRMDLGGLDVPFFYERGPYLVTCHVPEGQGTGSGVVSYWVDE